MTQYMSAFQFSHPERQRNTKYSTIVAHCVFAGSWICSALLRPPSVPGWSPSISSSPPFASWTWRGLCGSALSWAASWPRLSRLAHLDIRSTSWLRDSLTCFCFSLKTSVLTKRVSLQKKSIHMPIRSKYNRVTKRARYLYENPSCTLCNILHRYLQQADYSVIEEATMVSRTHSILSILSSNGVLKNSQGTPTSRFHLMATVATSGRVGKRKKIVK